MGDGFLSTFKTRGVVLKTREFKENDKLVWIFTEKLGKISAIAKGAKKGNSRFVPVTQGLCFADYVVYKGKSLYSINEAQIVDSFQDLMRDLETLTYSSYISELVDISLPDEESNRELFKDMVTALYLIKNKVGDIEVLIRAFEMKILKATGYNLNFKYCSKCRKKIKLSNYLDLKYFGPICNECDKGSSIKISNTTYNILSFLNDLSLEKVHRIILDDNTKKELYNITSNIISQIYVRKPKSLDMLKFIKGSD